MADFTDDFEGFNFELFHPFHALVFLNYLKNFVNKTECTDFQGNPTDEEYFHIDLSNTLTIGIEIPNSGINTIVKYAIGETDIDYAASSTILIKLLADLFTNSKK